ncbi:glycosyltransferase family 4 protein [Thermosynechococcus sp. HY213]|uniref:glycosyltransferase family 4 protein n=1 Tax=unclassified Thermosynechococcus TaxID=2622553 RepID=UPI001CEDB9F1|nr:MULTISPECIES: glycosyltransferase family 4 protein [unclassified Thermosynechococcus]MDR7921526.1 glycosyltransferase family 4 protein [Thermosynechococcus sp. HY213]
MRVLFFISSLSSGGAERVVANLANYWAEKGWEVTVVTLSDGADDFYELLPSVHRIKLGLQQNSGNVLKGLINNLRRVSALRRVLRQVQPDVALGMMDSSNIQLALAATGLHGLVTVGSEHIHPPQMPLGVVWETLRSYFYGRLDAVVALTDESATWLRQNTRARKVPVIPNAASYPLPAQAPYMMPPVKTGNAKLLLAVGRLSRQKGFDLLIAAFQGLAAAFPDWRLAILGEGPLRNELAAQIKNARLDERILLPGRVGNIGDWYQAADLYVMSSRFEGFGNTLAEALAYGLPAVSFDCDTGPRDIIRHEVDGLLVPPGDVAALSAALSRLMGDEALRQRFAARAIEARERFSMVSIAGMWEALFEELQHGK